jgi:hypothetical protein
MKNKIQRPHFFFLHKSSQHQALVLGIIKCPNAEIFRTNSRAPQAALEQYASSKTEEWARPQAAAALDPRPSPEMLLIRFI